MMYTIGFTTDDLGRTDPLRREREVNARLRDTVGAICDMTGGEGDTRRDGSLAMALAPEIVVGLLSGLAIDCRRGPDHIARDGDDALFLQVNLGAGPISGRHLGRDYDIAPGEAAFCVHNASVDFATGAGAGLLGITLPRHLTDAWTVAPEDLAARVIAADNPALRLLVPYARMFQSLPQADPGLVEASTRHMALLIGAAFGAIDTRAEGERHASAVGEARLSAIRRLMRADLASDGLTAAGIGQRLGISERMVQHILQQAGTSFSRQLGDFRAERARALLLDPAFAAVSTAEVGFRCGFNDVSSFYRAFRRRFDAAPGDIRVRV